MLCDAGASRVLGCCGWVVLSSWPGIQADMALLAVSHWPKLLVLMDGVVSHLRGDAV